MTLNAVCTLFEFHNWHFALQTHTYIHVRRSYSYRLGSNRIFTRQIDSCSADSRFVSFFIIIRWLSFLCSAYNFIIHAMIRYATFQWCWFQQTVPWCDLFSLSSSLLLSAGRIKNVRCSKGKQCKSCLIS